MTYAYEWLNQFQINNLKDVVVETTSNAILFKLVFNANQYIIEYENPKNLENLTTVECKELNQWMIVERNILEVFMEDVKLILKGSEVSLHTFHVTCSDKFQESIFDKLCEVLENSGKMKVKNLAVGRVSTREIVKLSRLLDHSELDTIQIFLPIEINADDFSSLVEMITGTRFNLLILLEKLSLEVLVEIKKLLQYFPIFRKIIVRYRRGLNVSFEDFFAPHAFKRVPREPGGVLEFEPDADESSDENRSKNNFGNWPIIFRVPHIMENVMKHLDFFQIQRLRKVSHEIRTTIDRINPDPRIFLYSIWGRSYYTIHTMFGLKQNYSESIVYREKGTRAGDTFKTVVDCEDVVSSVVNDFEINLKHQKTCLKEMRLFSYRTDLINKIGDALRSKNQRLKVEVLRIDVPNEESLMGIIPYLDPNYLRVIQLGSNDHDHYRSDGFPVTVENVCKLGQWKNAEELIIKSVFVINPLQDLNLTNFIKVDIVVGRLSTSDLVHLKNKLIHSTTLVKFKIQFRNSAIDESLYEIMSAYQRIDNVRSIWYYPMASPGNFLHIVLHNERRLIGITRVGRDSVPEELI